MINMDEIERLKKERDNWRRKHKRLAYEGWKWQIALCSVTLFLGVVIGWLLL